MQSDPVTRVLLGFIAICMLLLLAQGSGMFGGSSAQSAASGEGRYDVRVQSIRGGSLLVKTDTVTGSVWRKSLTGEGPWVLVDKESRPEPAADEAVDSADDSAPDSALDSVQEADS